MNLFLLSIIMLFVRYYLLLAGFLVHVLFVLDKFFVADFQHFFIVGKAEHTNDPKGYFAIQILIGLEII